MGNYGLKISKTGYDVKTATDNNLVFSSSFNTLKAYATGVVTISVNPVDVIDYGSVAHGLSYAPAFLVYNDGDDGYWHYSNSGGLQFYASPNYEESYAYTDDTYLQLVAENMFAGVTENRYLRYYLFKDEVT
jgi:hypothetical protein